MQKMQKEVVSESQYSCISQSLPPQARKLCFANRSSPLSKVTPLFYVLLHHAVSKTGKIIEVGRMILFNKTNKQFLNWCLLL